MSTTPVTCESCILFHIDSSSQLTGRRIKRVMDMLGPIAGVHCGTRDALFMSLTELKLTPTPCFPTCEDGVATFSINQGTFIYVIFQMRCSCCIRLGGRRYWNSTNVTTMAKPCLEPSVTGSISGHEDLIRCQFLAHRLLPRICQCPCPPSSGPQTTPLFP